MKKKLFYLSFAMGLAIVSLASCGKKNGGSSSSDREGYTVDKTKDVYRINFYDDQYDTDSSGKPRKDTKGNYVFNFSTKDTTTANYLELNAGTKIDWLPTPTREGYTFAGWYVDSSLSTKFYYDEMPEGDLIAYARWQIDNDVIYVSPSGSPTNDGSRKSKSMTLFEASRVYKPGAKIILAEGTYNECYTIAFGNEGSANAITTIEGEDPTKTIIDFSQMEEADANQGIKISGNYHRVSNITAKGAGDNGLLLGSSNNIISNCIFTENHDTGLQIGRTSGSTQPFIDQWPSNNYILNCTSYNNCDNEGEDADGFAAKLTVGYNNVFDGCLAYWNVDDGWDLYAKQDSGRIGLVKILNCVSLQNGKHLNSAKSGIDESFEGDGNGFKLGGTSVPCEVIVDNCVAAWNFAHGFTDNSNPGHITISNCTAINNGEFSSDATANPKEMDNFNLNRDGLINNKNYYSNLISYYSSKSNNVYNGFKITDEDVIKPGSDEFNGSINDSIFLQKGKYYKASGALSVQSGTGFLESEKNVSEYADPTGKSRNAVDDTNPNNLISELGTPNFHTKLRNADGSLNIKSYWKVSDSIRKTIQVGADLDKTSIDQYNHSYLTDVNENETAEESTAREVLDSIDLAVNKDYIYNDIYLPTSMRGVKISWSSSNTNAITISSDEVVVENGLNYTYGLIAARIDTDTKVTLTASITVGNKTYTKTFEVTCQALEPRIGTISGIDNVTQLDTEPAVNIDSYEVYDYTSSKLVLTAGKDYTVTKTIQYTNDYLSEKNMLTASGLTTVTSISNTGTYLITYTFTVNGYKSITKKRVVTIVDDSDTYKVTTASAYLNSVIDNNISITADANYYDGTVYIAAVAAGSTAPSAEDIKKGQSETTTIISTATSVTLTSRAFTANLPINVSETACDVYIVVENANGLGVVYKMSGIEPTQKIDSYAELVAALNEGTKAYELASNIDCGGATLTQDSSSTAFKGYFDGKDFAITNLNINTSAEGGGLFYKIKGTVVIKNLKLREVHVNQTNIDLKQYGKTGILVGCSEEANATIDRIFITDSSVNAYQRVGGIIGEVKGTKGATGSDIPTVKITRCGIYTSNSIDATKYSIRSALETKDAKGKVTRTSGKYVGGIVAHLQYPANLTIDSCYVKEPIYNYNQYCGGILGRVDPQSTEAKITVSNCIYGGTIEGSTYAGGIVGGRSSGLITIVNNAMIGNAGGDKSGMIVSNNLCQKKSIGGVNVYSINEYTTFENNYYGLADYDPDKHTDYTSSEEYIAAKTKNNEWYGNYVLNSTLITKEWYEQYMATFLESFEFSYINYQVQFKLKKLN